MNVHLRLGGGLARAARSVRLSLEMDDQATVADLLSLLTKNYPNLTSELEGAIVFVEGRHVGRAHQLLPDQELALVQPVAGGS